ncbi:hypothetical protein GCM10010170_032220 [Dactylosporangium salmoneum]|uniref:Uncharacterized protein n=1 Tax=Dactylosporangium salmoneum TaxID=53361 RepID=A0ABN3G7H0_9ACTN
MPVRVQLGLRAGLDRGGAHRVLEGVPRGGQLSVLHHEQAALLQAADGRLDQPGGHPGGRLDGRGRARAEHDGGEDIETVGLGEQAAQGCGSHKRRQYCQKLAIVG